MKVTTPDGYSLMATDWSIGGLRLDEIEGKLPAVNDNWNLTLELPFQGFDIAFEVEARIVRTVKETKTIGFEFIALSERANDLMSHFIDDLIRGHMATVEDTICRIDIPVTPISTKPDVNPSDEVPVKRLPVKMIVMSAIYSVLAVAIFGYLSILIYSKTMRMEVSSAVVSAPLATIKMPMDGILHPILMQEDVRVIAGQPIARIHDIKFETDLDEKRIQLDQAKRNLARTQEKYKIEEQRMKLYQIINKTDKQIAEARVESAKQALTASDAHLDRLITLRKKGLVAESKVDELRRQQSITLGRLKEAEYDLERATAMDAVSGRRYYNHKEFVSDLDILALEVEEANAQVMAASMQVEKLEVEKARMIIKAPFDGRIVSVKQPGNIMVLRNEQLFTIEKKEPPTVTAFLDQEQILSVGLHDSVKIFIPALDRHIPAIVTKIDRNSAFINDKASHYIWDGQKQKSAAVSLSIQITEEERNYIYAGLPAVVVFPKRSTSAIYNQLGATVTRLKNMFNDETSI
jgi:multidrug resistance efflux pump